VKELVDKRDLHHKIFDLGGNKRKLVASIGPIHLPDDIERWKAGLPVNWLEPDITFRRVGNAWKIGYNWFDITIPDGKVGYQYVSRLGGTMEVSLKELGTSPYNPNPNLSPVLVGEKLVWKDVRPGLDIELFIRPAKIELQKVIHRSAAPHRLVWERVEKNITATLREKTEAKDNLNRIPERENEKRFNRERPVIVNTTINKIGDVTTYIEKVTTDTIRKDPVTRVKEIRQGEIVYPILVDQDITENIVANADDGTERGGTSWYADGDYDNFNYGGWISSAHSPGLRFQGIAVGQGDTIDADTRIKIIIDGGVTGGDMDVYGDDVDDAVAWSASSRPSQVTKTTATTLWQPGTSGTSYIDVQAIVQEIVNRGSWASGNDMRFALLGRNIGYAVTTWKDYAHSTFSNDAQLEINYTAAGGGGLGIPIAMYHYSHNMGSKL